MFYQFNALLLTHISFVSHSSTVCATFDTFRIFFPPVDGVESDMHAYCLVLSYFVLVCSRTALHICARRASVVFDPEAHLVQEQSKVRSISMICFVIVHLVSLGNNNVRNSNYY